MNFCLAVEHCWVFCIGSCELVHEDRTNTEVINILLTVFRMCHVAGRDNFVFILFSFIASVIDSRKHCFVASENKTGIIIHKSFKKTGAFFSFSGAKICKLSSPLGLSLELVKSTIEKVQHPSKVIMQGFHEGQNCTTMYCQERGGGSSCTECSLVDEGFSKAIPKITTWKQHMTSCHEDLGAANALLDKLSVVSALFETANAIIDEAETFLKPAADELEKFAKSLGPVMKKSHVLLSLRTTKSGRVFYSTCAEHSEFSHLSFGWFH